MRTIFTFLVSLAITNLFAQGKEIYDFKGLWTSAKSGWDVTAEQPWTNF